MLIQTPRDLELTLLTDRRLLTLHIVECHEDKIFTVLVVPTFWNRLLSFLWPNYGILLQDSLTKRCRELAPVGISINVYLVFTL